MVFHPKLGGLVVLYCCYSLDLFLSTEVIREYCGKKCNACLKLQQGYFVERMVLKWLVSPRDIVIQLISLQIPPLNAEECPHNI